MEFNQLVKDRYSCKKYDPDRPVSDEQLQAILEAGQAAPTAKNLQGQHIYVARTPESLALVDQVTPCRYGATCVLVVAYDKQSVFVFPGGQANSGMEDMSIIATHMMLAAAAQGVDSCWLNFFDPADAKAKLGLPENEEVALMLDLGFAAPDGGPLPNHSKRKGLSQTVTYL